MTVKKIVFIAVFQVEHVHDPLGFLVECHRILKSNGQIVLLTPNLKSIGHRLFSDAWFHLDPPRHLYLFSLQTLKICVERANLQIKVIRTTARLASLAWIVSRLIGKKGISLNGLPQKVSWPLRLEGMAFQAMEHGICTVCNLGEEILLVATKECKK